MITEIVTKPELKLSTGGDGRWRIRLFSSLWLLLADLEAQPIEDRGVVVYLRASGEAIADGYLCWGIVVMPDGTQMPPARCEIVKPGAMDCPNMTMLWNNTLRVIPGAFLTMDSIRVSWDGSAKDQVFR